MRWDKKDALRKAAEGPRIDLQRPPKKSYGAKEPLKRSKINFVCLYDKEDIQEGARQSSPKEANQEAVEEDFHRHTIFFSCTMSSIKSAPAIALKHFSQ